MRGYRNLLDGLGPVWKGSLMETPPVAESSLRFYNYVVNRVLFETNSAFSPEQVQLSLRFSRQIEMDLPDLHVTLSVVIFPNATENNYPFTMALSITGYFTLEGETAEAAQQLAEINAVAILYPFLRAMVSTYSANANVAPVLLPTINVAQYFADEEPQE